MSASYFLKVYYLTLLYHSIVIQMLYIIENSSLSEISFKISKNTILCFQIFNSTHKKLISTQVGCHNNLKSVPVM